MGKTRGKCLQGERELCCGMGTEEEGRESHHLEEGGKRGRGEVDWCWNSAESGFKKRKKRKQKYNQ